MGVCISADTRQHKLRGIPNVSLPPGTSCRPGAPCYSDCYARKAWRQYRGCRTAWAGNLRVWRRSPEAYERAIRTYLERKQPSFYRWHVAGDIPDRAYLRMMLRIARDMGATRFLAFTKRYAWVQRLRKVPGNLSIVLSAWPGLRLPHKPKYPIAFMQDGTEHRADDALPCPGRCDTCGMCWNLKTIGRNVVFPKH